MGYLSISSDILFGYLFQDILGTLFGEAFPGKIHIRSESPGLNDIIRIPVMLVVKGNPGNSVDNC